MATATIENKQLIEFAEQVYEEQKADFIKNLAEHIQKSIDIGMTQIKNGESMSLEESKRRIDQKYFKNFINEKI